MSVVISREEMDIYMIYIDALDGLMIAGRQFRQIGRDDIDAQIQSAITELTKGYEALMEIKYPGGYRYA